jgi:hypothetical protein
MFFFFIDTFRGICLYIRFETRKSFDVEYAFSRRNFPDRYGHAWRSASQEKNLPYLSPLIFKRSKIESEPPNATRRIRVAANRMSPVDGPIYPLFKLDFRRIR